MKTKSLIPTILALSLSHAMAGSPTMPVETPITMPEVSEWQVRAALYGWAQGLDGDIAVQGTSAPVDIGFDDILENLDIAVMGLVEINRGRWGFLADFNYAKISDKVPTGAGVVDFEEKQFVGNFFVTYEALQTETFKFDVYGGVRVNWLEVNLTLPPDSVSADKSWVDPVIGARFQSELGENFFVRGVADIGGFGVASDLTWQAMLGLGYRVTDNGSLFAGYRALSTDYSSGGFTYDLVASGLLIGFEYRF
jgi:opacity protein-like surface antigen